MKNNNNYTTLVIGGSQGLGFSLAEHLARQGHHISIMSRTAPPLQEGIQHFPTDLCNEEVLNRSLKEIRKCYPSLNNIVFLQRNREKEDSWNKELKLSLTATKTIIESLKDLFLNGGSITLVTSVVDHFIGSEQPLEYHVAKAGMNQMARYYAARLGPSNIRCNVVSPSIFIKEHTKEYHASESRRLLYKKAIPLGRAADAIEVCNVIEFLCSDKSSYITGQNIAVDGGLSTQAHLTLAEKFSLYSP